jgi:hypothetical protein
VFIDVREHRLDLSSSRFRVRERGRARSSGFCRSMFPRARLGTARTPPPPNLRWGRLPDSGPGLPGRGQSPNGHEARGRGETAPRRSPRRLLAPETSPQPRPSSDASCRGRRSLTLYGVTWGEREAAIATRACKARARQGCGTPRFREEARRSLARGTFRRKVVRERTKGLLTARRAEPQ